MSAPNESYAKVRRAIEATGRHVELIDEDRGSWAAYATDGSYATGDWLGDLIRNIREWSTVPTTRADHRG